MAKYALVIGLDRYDHFSNLKSAAKDAEAIAQLLEQHQYRVTRLPRKLLENQWAIAPDKSLGHNELGQELKTFFRERAKNQEAILYFAGHGFRVSDALTEKEKGYLATSNATNQGENAIPFNSLNELMSEAQLSSLVVMMDCCYAGSLLEEQRSLLQPTQTILSHKQNSCLIAACRDFERAREGKEHGIFTAAILKGLSAENAVAETVTSNDLFGFVERELRTSGQEVIHAGMGGAIDLVHYPELVTDIETSLKPAPEPEKVGEEAPNLGKFNLPVIRLQLRTVLPSLCVLMAGIPLAYFFWQSITNSEPAQTETVNPPQIDSNDQSQINSDSRISDIRVSSDATHLALLTAAGHLEVREINLEKHIFEPLSLEENPKYQNERFQKIDFLPGSTDFENERELFVASRLDKISEIGKYFETDGHNYTGFCLLEESQSGSYFFESKFSKDASFLVIASDSTSDIYLLKVLKDRTNGMYVGADEQNFCFHLDPDDKNMIPSEEVVDLEFSPAPEFLLLATVHADNKVRLWQICSNDQTNACDSNDNHKAFKMIAIYQGDERDDLISSISFNSNGSYLALGYDNEEIKLLQVDNTSLELVTEFRNSDLVDTSVDNMIVNFSSSKDEPNILFSAANSKLRKWNIEEFKPGTSRSELLKEYQGEITHLYGLSSSSLLLAVDEEQHGPERRQNSRYFLRLESF